MRSERGQVLPLVAGLIVVLLGMTALAVDIGGFVAHRRSLQNAADAMALAAAQELADPVTSSVRQAVIDRATQWGEKNGIDPDEIEEIRVIPKSGQNPNPEVQVRIREDHRFVFARAIGITSHDVTASAGAIKTTPGGTSGVVPWALLNSEVQGAIPGALVTLKYDANNPMTGNFGPIRIDGSGSGNCGQSDKYCSGVKYGSDSTICSQAAVSAGTCQENAPECSGASCQTQPGNVVGATRQAVDWRLAKTDPACDAFGEVFSDPDGDHVYQIAQQCNPFIPGSKSSERVVIIPLISNFGPGSQPVTITGFVLAFLEGYDAGKCQGNACEIKARFVQAELTTGALTGVYDEDALLKFVRLVE
ncbi:MAG TPA: pilus assembly protein TadG-related protein [Dehalococcoidia bacterium]|nr:pilus assembly protein TadG-related protein [Dehalococcoidia bacterium]